MVFRESKTAAGRHAGHALRHRTIGSTAAVLLLTAVAAAQAGSPEAQRLEMLDEACAAKRSLMLDLTRSARIRECIQQAEMEPDRCRRFYSDYGNPTRTREGHVRPGLYQDLPECRAAQRLRQGTERFASP
jgi:hypothetical protein